MDIGAGLYALGRIFHFTFVILLMLIHGEPEKSLPVYSCNNFVYCQATFIILQVSAVTQTELGGLTIYPPVANFL